MSDYSKLKALAEAATVGDKPATTPIHELIGAMDAFHSAATPPAVLELIEEVYQFKAAAFDQEAGRHAMEREIAQLKAENESLRGSCKAMGADMVKLTRERNSFRSRAEKLGAENEALRKELAARHPFKPALDEPVIGYTGCVICGRYTDHGGLQCPNTRAFSLSRDNQRITPVEPPIAGPHPLDLLSKESPDTCRSEQGPETPETPAQQGPDCGSERA